MSTQTGGFVNWAQMALASAVLPDPNPPQTKSPTRLFAMTLASARAAAAKSRSPATSRSQPDAARRRSADWTMASVGTASGADSSTISLANASKSTFKAIAELLSLLGGGADPVGRLRRGGLALGARVGAAVLGLLPRHAGGLP